MNWEAFMDETVANIGALSREIPDTARAFNTLGAAAKKPGALDEKTKEIMALGIAIATRCVGRGRYEYRMAEVGCLRTEN